MYEEYYGFIEKPFSLTPDPKYLYRSQSHGSAFDLLQYAIKRREGFVVITGDIGAGKTTLCRALLEQLDQKTFTALVLNPFLSEEDLLKLILQDFGVVSRSEVKRGRLANVSKQELIDTLNDFLLSLLPLNAGALLIIDEAQNLPLHVLEQIRILSNLETNKEKLLQIVLVGQLNLQTLIRSPQLRQLDQRISIRYELTPLDRDEVAAYVAHRLAVAGCSAAVTFIPKALSLVHRYSGGIPRLINLICDRALLGAYAEHTNRIVPKMVKRAAESLDLECESPRLFGRLRRRLVAVSAGLSVAAVAAGSLYWSTLANAGAIAVAPPAPPLVVSKLELPSPPPTDLSRLGSRGGSFEFANGQPYSILVGSSRDQAVAASLTGQLIDQGYAAYQVKVEANQGRWWQVLVGQYVSAARARAEVAQLKQVPEFGDARLLY